MEEHGYYISEGKKYTYNHLIRRDLIYYINNIHEHNSLFLFDYYNITKLILNNKVQYVVCTENKITELYLPKSIKHLRCDMGVKLYNIPKNCEIHFSR